MDYDRFGSNPRPVVKLPSKSDRGLTKLERGCEKRLFKRVFNPTSQGNQEALIFTQVTTSRRFALTLTLALVLLCLFSLAGCERQGPPSKGGSDTDAGGFTFLELGANTPVNEDLRHRLKRRLGSEAVVRRTPIDLEAGGPALLTAHLPDLAELNKALNWPPRERVEHAATMLTYRYIDPTELPFDKVVLVFTDPAGLPLLLNAYAGADGETLLAPLEAKYGTPEQIDWQGHRTRIWTQGRDRLLFTSSRDQYDRPRHQITIYYTDNLQRLREIERDTNQQRPPSEKGRSIF
jgi:hypothetical protein